MATLRAVRDIQIDSQGCNRCWSCGGKNFTQGRTTMAKVTVGVGALLTKKKLRCTGCGAWNDVGNAKPFNRPDAATPTFVPPRTESVPHQPQAMRLSDEVERLAALHDRGVLTDSEFVAAKANLIADRKPQSGLGAPFAPPVPGSIPGLFASAVPTTIRIEDGRDYWHVELPADQVMARVRTGISDAGFKINDRRSKGNEVWTALSGNYWRYNGCQIRFVLQDHGSYTTVSFASHGGGSAAMGQGMIRKALLPRVRAALVR